MSGYDLLANRITLRCRATGRLLSVSVDADGEVGDEMLQVHSAGRIVAGPDRLDDICDDEARRVAEIGLIASRLLRRRLARGGAGGGGVR